MARGTGTGRRSVRKTITQRPAETSALSAAVALLIAKFVLKIDDAETIMALAVVIGALPAVVTGLVEKARKAANEAADTEKFGGSQ